MRTPKTFQSHLPSALDARAVRTRKALRQAMLELLERRRFEDITIGELAAAARVGYSTVCRHYPTLGALLDEIAAEQISCIVSQAFPTFDVTDTRAATVALFRYVHEHRAVWTTLLTGGAAGALRQEFLRISMELARAWNRAEVWLPAELGVTMTITGTIELLTWWLQQDQPMSPEDMAGIYQRLLIAPLLTPSPAQATVATSVRTAPRSKPAASRRRR